METCRTVLYHLQHEGNDYPYQLPGDSLLSCLNHFAGQDKAGQQRDASQQFNQEKDICISRLIIFNLVLYTFIKEFEASMSDIFQIVPKSTAKPKVCKLKENIMDRYALLQGEFISTSYGYYSNYFIQKIAAQAVHKNEQIQLLSIRKILRDLVRKFMVSDLELVFIGYIANIIEWNFNKSFYKQNYHKIKMNWEHSHKNAQILNLFLYLISFFVKTYLGKMEESAALADIISIQTEGEWDPVYEEWLKICPTEMFNLSPRDINTLFTNYAKDCQQNPLSKNYNTMVDRILQLSTTYSMMPGEVKQQKKKQPDLIEVSSKGRKKVKKNIITQGFVSNISKKQQSGMNQHFFLQSRLSNNFLQSGSKPKEDEGRQQKKPLLKLKTKNAQVSSHINEFYSKKQYDMPAREQYRPQSTIGFQNLGQSYLDFNNRSSAYEAIPYTLKNSNLSGFWK